MAMFMANIVDLKARLSELVDRAAKGERILICRHNRPVAELRPVADARTEPRPIGPLPNRPTFDVAASFMEPMTDEELREWEDSPLSGSRASPARAKGRPSRAAEKIAGPSFRSSVRKRRS